MKAGYIQFDDPDLHGPGWACHENGRPFRLRDLSDIGNETVWMTNLNYTQSYRAGLINHAYLRRSSFLRLPLHSIMDELGIKEAPPHEQVKVISSIFGRVARLASHHLAYPKIPMGELRQMVREVLIPPDPRMPSAMIDAVRNAYQDFSFCERVVPNRQGRKLTFWFPRVDYARSMLSLRVPATPKIEVVKSKDFPPPDRPEALTEWIIELAMPALMRVRINGILNDHIAPLINYGGGVRSFRERVKGRMIRSDTPTRQWMTSYEVLALAPFVGLTIQEVWCFPETHRFIDLPLVKAFFDSVTPAHRVSYSTGLFAENLWAGATAPLEQVPKANESVNLAGPFIRAHDRALAFKSARILHDLGFAVSGYGAGRVWVEIFGEDEESLIMEGARETGMIPPVMDRDGQSVFKHADHDLAVMQTIAMRGAWDAFDQLDRFAVPDDLHKKYVA